MNGGGLRGERKLRRRKSFGREDNEIVLDKLHIRVPWDNWIKVWLGKYIFHFGTQ